MLDKLKEILAILIGLIIIGALFFGIIYLDWNRHNEITDNPPTQDWLEEDLEPIFMTTDVYVYPDVDHEGEDVYCIVKANGFYYKVHYCLVHSFFGSWYWKYDKYIQIKESEI